MIMPTKLNDLTQPLFERAAHPRLNTKLKDRAAGFVLERLGLECTSEAKRSIAREILQATHWIDSKINAFFEAHPSAQGIEVDSGLSTRFHRLSELSDWPRFSWQMINKPDVAAYLDYIFPPLDNFRNIASATPFVSWPTHLGWQSAEAVIVVLGENSPLPAGDVMEHILHAYHSVQKRGVKNVQLLVHHPLHSLAQLAEQQSAKISILDECTFSTKTKWTERIMSALFNDHAGDLLTLTQLEFNLK